MASTFYKSNLQYHSDCLIAEIYKNESFFINCHVAPGRRWHVKKKTNFEDHHYAQLLFLRLLSLVLVEIKIFFRDHFVFIH